MIEKLCIQEVFSGALYEMGTITLPVRVLQWLQNLWSHHIAACQAAQLLLQLKYIEFQSYSAYLRAVESNFVITLK